MTTPIPRQIAGIEVPDDRVSAATWRHARRILPRYLLFHSVRSYCWGATIAAGEGWTFDREVLWTASLLHDAGLTQLPRNDDCFEVAGGAQARRWLERAGMAPEAAQTVEKVIVLHMQPTVTLDDGVEAVLLDRATSLDARAPASRRSTRSATPLFATIRARASTAVSWTPSDGRRRAVRTARAPGSST